MRNIYGPVLKPSPGLSNLTPDMKSMSVKRKNEEPHIGLPPLPVPQEPSWGRQTFYSTLKNERTIYLTDSVITGLHWEVEPCCHIDFLLSFISHRLINLNVNQKCLKPRLISICASSLAMWGRKVLLTGPQEFEPFKLPYKSRLKENQLGGENYRVVSNI